MKKILKLVLASLLVSFAFVACDNDADRDWTTPEPSFKLYETVLSSNVLYPTMENNPFILKWDNSASSNGTYSVVLSASDDFSEKVELGTASTNNLKTTIGALNTALLQAGFSPYVAQTVFVRVETGSEVSNTISFSVTPYPSDVPVIVNPTSGSSFTLDSQTPAEVVTTVEWTDYATYGVDVTYEVFAALSGSGDFQSLGTTTNLKTLDVTHKKLNDMVLETGGTVDVENAVDIKVVSSTVSTGGTITKESEIVTFTVVPYLPEIKNLYLVGDATAAGWSPDNNNQAIFRDPETTSKFYFTGYFGTSMFKLLETLGSWQPQWGLKNGVVANSDGGDPDPFTTDASGYYTFTVDILAKTYSFEPYTGTMTSYSSLGLIGDFNGWGGDLSLTQSTFDPHQWSVKNVTLTAGSAKFRANGGWDVNWGADTELSGQGTQGGANIPVSEGVYDIYFNDIDGRYLFVKH